MSTDRIADRLHDRPLLTFAGAALVVLGLHFVVEAALGRVHALPDGGPLARAYALVAAALFLAVGGALLRTGRIRDRRFEWVAAVLAGLVLVLVAASHLLG